MGSTSKKKTRSSGPTDEIVWAEYPALYMCVVIDSKHSSRHGIVKNLKSSGLFENIIEAVSAADGLATLRRSPVDACIIGPSLTTPKAAELVRLGLKTSLAEDCAFVAVTDGDEDAGKLLLENGAHSTVEKKATKRAFTEGIIRGVIQANKDGIWASISLLHNDGLAVIDDTELIRKNPSLEQVDYDLYEDQIQVETILSHVAPDLRELFKGVKEGRFGVQKDGTPTPETRKAIEDIIKNVLQENMPTPSMLNNMSEFLKRAMFKWLYDLDKFSLEEANDKLKEVLQSYSP